LSTSKTRIETPRSKLMRNPCLTDRQAIPSRTFLVFCSLTPQQS